MFTNSALVGPVHAMKTADMSITTDISECALPPTTDKDTHLSQSEKAMQIGHDACNNILHACLDHLKAPDASISIVDLTPIVAI